MVMNCVENKRETGIKREINVAISTVNWTESTRSSLVRPEENRAEP